MIIVVCTDDARLVQVARQSQNAHPATFGRIYQAFKDPIPPLGVNEPLFIIAHGAMEGDGGNPVIGDERKAFYVNAVEFYLNFKGIFPPGYAAGIFVDACESADGNRNTFSFIEVLKAQVQADHSVRVFGRNGTADGQIPLPTSGGWVEA